MNDRDAVARNKPLGKVTKVNDDGTCMYELDLTNPDAACIAAAGLIGGTEAARQVLREQQSRDRN